MQVWIGAALGIAEALTIRGNDVLRAARIKITIRIRITTRIRIRIRTMIKLKIKIMNRCK